MSHFDGTATLKIQFGKDNTRYGILVFSSVISVSEVKLNEENLFICWNGKQIYELISSLKNRKNNFDNRM